MDSTTRIAVIGGGPRGIAVTEQLALAAKSRDVDLQVDVIDQHCPGAGRVWSPEQSPHLLMNTHSREVTIYSGPQDRGPSRPGAGPSLEEWIIALGEPISDGYCSRGTYGRYLQDAFRNFIAHSSQRVSIQGVQAGVYDVSFSGEEYSVHRSDSEVSNYHSVVLATGHPRQRGSDVIDQTASRLIQADSAADLDLGPIEAGSAIATVGLGLSFHDIVALLTCGRGGSFEGCGKGLVYIPSGAEPRIIGVSRSGLPIPSRGVNQKAADHSFSPTLCTAERMLSVRKSGRVSFSADVEPWILAEATLTYARTVLEREHPDRVEQLLRSVAKTQSNPVGAVQRIAGGLGVTERMASIYALARPFEGKTFCTYGQWASAVTEHMASDIDRALRGNVRDPLKAALDTLRDLRPMIRLVVDDGGLDPVSHEQDFLGRFAPAYSLMVAGPPVSRNQQLAALISAGVVVVAPPGTRISETGTGSFLLRETGTRWVGIVDRVIDARIPGYAIGRCRSELYPNLLDHGLVRRYRHEGTYSSVETGACESDIATGRVIGSTGSPVQGLSVIGIPTERQRWFTQIGNGRPGVESSFTSEARKVARTALFDAMQIRQSAKVLA